jgi:phosphatidate cytidylyltransferase
MAPPSAQGKPGPVALRIVSAAVMLPIAAVAVWLGGWVFASLVSIAAGLMYWEWQGLCGENGDHTVRHAIVCGAGPLVLVGFGIKAAAIVGAGGGVFRYGLRGGENRQFLVAGFVYIYLACIAMVWLRGLIPAGMETVIWLGAVVVATDTAAYFTGRTLGGPKLAPKISPKKTWSGLLGGMSGAAIAGGVVAANVEGANILTLGLMGGGFAVIAQLGDLLVSKAKRAFGVKDSSNLIPGHGGVLDRLDGFLSASLVLAALTLLGGGSPLTWP